MCKVGFGQPDDIAKSPNKQNTEVGNLVCSADLRVRAVKKIIDKTNQLLREIWDLREASNCPRQG